MILKRIKKTKELAIGAAGAAGASRWNGHRKRSMLVIMAIAAIAYAAASTAGSAGIFSQARTCQDDSFSLPSLVMATHGHIIVACETNGLEIKGTLCSHPAS